MKYKKPLIISLTIIIALSAAYYFYQKQKNTVYNNYSVLVFVHDQKTKDPIEDARSSNKAGDVMTVLKEDHNWSTTEKTSYLILKMRLSDAQAAKIIEPVTEKRSKEEIEKEIEEMKKNNPETKNEDIERRREELENELITVRSRKYRIDFEKLPKPFTPNDLVKGQPFADQVFDWDIVEKK